MATILKRPGPKGKMVWQAQVRKKGFPSHIKTFDRKADAERWARKIESEIETGLWKDVKEAGRVTLAQALARYLSSVTIRKRPSTQKSEHFSAARLKKEMGELSLLQVTPERVAQYRDMRLKTVSANSVRVELALLSQVYTVASREWSFSALDNPVNRIQKPKLPEGRCPVLSEEQIVRLLSECKRTETTKYTLYPFVLLALHTGCRSMELRGMRWSQVNLQEGYISLVAPETKGNRSRIIPLTPAAQQILTELAEKQGVRNIIQMDGKPAGLVFPSRKHPDKPRDMHTSFNAAVHRAGLGDIPGAGKFRIHDLRHVCGTFLVMNGVDLETVRTILGHRDLVTTQRYLHVVNEHKKKAVAKIGHLGLVNSAAESRMK